MVEFFKKMLRPILDFCPRCGRDPYRQSSYSQDGEDRVLVNLLRTRSSGFFIDVGAHHPKRFSNTYLFYQHGWRGINIDPDPAVKPLFDQLRPRDTTLTLAVGLESEEKDFHIFDDPAYNTFDLEETVRFRERGFPKLRAVIKSPVVPLREILKTHLPEGQHIDFLTVDAEGWDFFVLKSNDWSRFRPEVVVAESAGKDLEQTLSSPVHELLRQNGYELTSRLTQSVVYLDRQSLPNA